MSPIHPPMRRRTLEELLHAIAESLPLSGGSTHGSLVSGHSLVSEEAGVSTYIVDARIDRTWDVYGHGDDGASGRARVRVRPYADGFEAFEIGEP